MLTFILDSKVHLLQGRLRKFIFYHRVVVLSRSNVLPYPCYIYSSPSTEDSFTFTRPNPFVKTPVARIPEEDDVMEAETGSGAENSSGSLLESENETGKYNSFVINIFRFLDLYSVLS